MLLRFNLEKEGVHTIPWELPMKLSFFFFWIERKMDGAFCWSFFFFFFFSLSHCKRAGQLAHSNLKIQVFLCLAQITQEMKGSKLHSNLQRCSKIALLVNSQLPSNACTHVTCTFPSLLFLFLWATTGWQLWSYFDLEILVKIGVSIIIRIKDLILSLYK